MSLKTPETCPDRPFLHDNLSYRALVLVFLGLFSASVMAAEIATISETKAEIVKFLLNSGYKRIDTNVYSK